MKTWLSALMAVFYRRRCLQCGDWNFDLVCPGCWDNRSLAPGDLSVPGLESALAVLAYEGVGKHLVKALKYRRCEEAVSWLLEGETSAAHLAAGKDCLVVPVPLHPERLRSRGFNQADRLARRLARRHRWLYADVLRRCRATPPLYGLSRKARRQALSGAIHCVQAIQGRQVLLVDDVVTTGATAQACARALREAGAVAVHLLAATATPEGHDEKNSVAERPSRQRS